MARYNNHKQKIDYGHDYLVDQKSLSLEPRIDYRSTKAKWKYLSFLIVLALFAVLLFVDAFMQLYRQEYVAHIKRHFQVQDVSELLSQKNNIQLKNLAERNIYAWDEIQQNMSFFSQNSFYLASSSVFIYANPTNLSGRFFSSIAKRFHVAIILKNTSHFEIPKHLNLMDVQNFNLKFSNKDTYILIEMDISAEHWSWFGRVLTRSLLTEPAPF